MRTALCALLQGTLRFRCSTLGLSGEKLTFQLFQLTLHPFVYFVAVLFDAMFHTVVIQDNLDLTIALVDLERTAIHSEDADNRRTPPQPVWLPLLARLFIPQPFLPSCSRGSVKKCGRGIFF